jgi:hypothetical protein
MKTRRNELINFLPIVTLFAAIFTIETATLGSTQHGVGQALMLVHIIAFYVISIRMLFVKNLSKWLILLILFPFTAVFTYIGLLFVKPRPKRTSAPAEQSA